MKRSIKNVLSIGLTSLLCATAAQSFAAQDNTSAVGIKHISVYHDWAQIVLEKSVKLNHNQCVGRDHVILRIRNGKDIDTMLATAMSAHLAGRKVSFGIDGCYTVSQESRPLAYRIDLK